MADDGVSFVNPLASIAWGSKQDDNTVSYRFVPAGGTWDTPAGQQVVADAWSAYEMQQVQLALSLFANVCDLTFNLTGGSADLTLISTDDLPLGTLGAMDPPDEPLEGVGVFSNDQGGWSATPGQGLEQGGKAFQTILHELGHGLGLAHPHDGGGSSTIMPGVGSAFDDYGDFSLNQGVFTMMSYNSGWPAEAGPAPTAFGNEGTPMAFDIAVLQAIYGANTGYRTGDDVYVIPDSDGAGTFYSCIWDAGGDDEIRYDGTRDVTIDLRPATLQQESGGGGRVSFAMGINGGFTIAAGVVIERAWGGSGDDAIFGDDSVNQLFGNGGDDALNGGGDTDLLNGGAGADVMHGVMGNDTYVIDDVGDQAFESPGNGTDTIISSITYILGDHFENLTLSGAAAINGQGNDDDNTIVGNGAGNIINGGLGTNQLFGGGGDDSLSGTGIDQMSGGGDDDLYVINDAGDAVTELFNQGTDRVESFIDYSLTSNVENLLLIGAAISGTGNGLDNAITGNEHANVLDGGAGNDVLDGGIGADQMFGGDNDDRYLVDHVGDFIGEAPDAGDDVAVARISYFLPVFVETLILDDAGGAINGTGNNQDETLIGNSFANVLDGGTGADRMEGGSGDDAYFIDNVGDLVVEGAGGGFDQVLSGSSHITLGDNVEALILTGMSNKNGIGNALANVLTGSSGTNVLKGNEGNDRINGGAGADRMEGGGGNDIFYVDHTGDRVIERFNAGTDRVLSSVSFTLGSNVENLTITGGSNRAAIGNGFDNVIIGNDALNSLKGNTGDDRLLGKAGNDRIYGGSGADMIEGGVGVDTLTGNVGRDYFIFRSLDESRTSTPTSDLIIDFLRSNGDRLHIATIDADTGRSGNQAFEFIGRSGFSEAGQARYTFANGDTYVWLNVDADRAAESMFRVNGQKTLVAGDFIL
jgi:Ca2+-binding RTX toxin-like protein